MRGDNQIDRWSNGLPLRKPISFPIEVVVADDGLGESGIMARGLGGGCGTILAGDLLQRPAGGGWGIRRKDRQLTKQQVKKLALVVRGQLAELFEKFSSSLAHRDKLSRRPSLASGFHIGKAGKNPLSLRDSCPWRLHILPPLRQRPVPNDGKRDNRAELHAPDFARPGDLDPRIRF